MAANPIHETGPLPLETLEGQGLQWFVQGENHDYIPEEFIELHPTESQDLLHASAVLIDYFVQAIQVVAREGRWSELHLPNHCIRLLQYSIERELGNYLIGRFDFSGGLAQIPPRLIEFNGDTCSLLPETAFIQEEYWEQERAELPPGEPYNELMVSLTERFEYLLERYPDREATLLITTMGGDDDWLNADVISEAAERAGFDEVHYADLQKVTFSPEEGIFLEVTPGNYLRFDFWYKMLPWDFFLFEEPELFAILDRIVRQELCIILNPAFAMLLQNKGLLKIIYELYPNAPEVLRAGRSAVDFPDQRFVSKPFFGRMGENISLHDGQVGAKVKTEGDYGSNPMLYQELAPFYTDLEGHRYQPSVFWTGEASAICIRRQDSLIIDDDAEFLCHIVAEKEEED